VHGSGRPTRGGARASGHSRANEWRVGEARRREEALDRDDNRDNENEYGERDSDNVKMCGEQWRADDHNKVDDRAAVVVHPFRLDEEGARSPTCERPNC